MKQIFVALLIFGCLNVSAEDLSEKYAPVGQLIYTPFESAPFPHPLRTNGHQYQNRFFSAAEHYQDNHVILFVPKGFHAGSKIDFVLHFHGWGNSITNGVSKYKLIDQFVASRRNAILVLPEGPVNASDSFGGKLEDVNGFHRFMDEAMATLKQRQIIKDQAIGKIILSGHSGGYEVISSIVAWGGLNENIREVWLFDALYANTERFVVWFDHHKGRFIDLYTEHGGTKSETQNLMAALKENKAPFFSSNETNATPHDLRANHLVFLFSELPHDETVQHRNTFQEFLETSSLGKTRR